VTGWPLFDLRLRVDGLELRPVTDADLDVLVRLLPAGVDLDPRYDAWPGLVPAADRGRVLRQSVWAARGTWRPGAWELPLTVVRNGGVAGVQILEAPGFASDATVNTTSWLVPRARGRGLGTSMRRAVLALAFDELGAVAAVSSAWEYNAASLAVSAKLGYVVQDVRPHAAGGREGALVHLKLDASAWSASRVGAGVRVEGLDACRAWFR
jgi:RimJ/RimL family protein N-acetyltransferase